MKKHTVYLSEVYSEENIKKTRYFVTKTLKGCKERKGIKNEKPYLFIIFNDKNIQNFRDKWLNSNEEKDISVFEIPYFLDKEYANQVILLQNQDDSFSCAGAVLFTCTAGFAKTEPRIINSFVRRLNVIDNPWALVSEYVNPYSGKKQYYSNDWESLLTVEGVPAFVFENSGILPTLMFGKVAKEIEKDVFEELEEEENMFQDIRFRKLMNIMRYASICTFSGVHWYSFVCIPNDVNFENDCYVTFNSLEHDSATFYFSYESFRREFLLVHTTNCSEYPLTLALYPVIQEHENADPIRKKVSKIIIERSIKNMEENDKPFVDWSVIRNIIDEFFLK